MAEDQSGSVLCCQRRYEFRAQGLAKPGQCEAAVTSERIRDKIAASKKKGMWMGGTVPLGYDLPSSGTGKLLVNAAEAEQVRYIFRTFLEHRSVYELERRLRHENIHSKRFVTRCGRQTGGPPFSRGALLRLLRNRAYLGQITHRGDSYPGLHDATVDAGSFEEVQSMLDAHAVRRRATREKVGQSPLTGRMVDADRQTMSPTFAYGKAGGSTDTMSRRPSSGAIVGTPPTTRPGVYRRMRSKPPLRKR